MSVLCSQVFQGCNSFQKCIQSSWEKFDWIHFWCLTSSFIDLRSENLKTAKIKCASTCLQTWQWIIIVLMSRLQIHKKNPENRAVLSHLKIAADKILWQLGFNVPWQESAGIMQQPTAQRDEHHTVYAIQVNLEVQSSLNNSWSICKK